MRLLIFALFVVESFSQEEVVLPFESVSGSRSLIPQAPPDFLFPSPEVPAEPSIPFQPSLDVAEPFSNDPLPLPAPPVPVIVLEPSPSDTLDPLPIEPPFEPPQPPPVVLPLDFTLPPIDIDDNSTTLNLRCQNDDGTLKPSADDCEDELPTCDVIFERKVDLDNSTDAVRPQLCEIEELQANARKCAKTCKICCEKTATCKDNAVGCAGMKAMCRDFRFHSLMSKQCPKTCKICKEESEVTTAEPLEGTTDAVEDADQSTVQPDVTTIEPDSSEESTKSKELSSEEKESHTTTSPAA
jgi:hypothetical protein